MNKGIYAFDYKIEGFGDFAQVITIEAVNEDDAKKQYEDYIKERGVIKGKFIGEVYINDEGRIVIPSEKVFKSRGKTICDYCKKEIKPNEVHYKDFEQNKKGGIIDKYFHIECRKRSNKNILKTIGDRLTVLRHERELTEEEFEKRYNLKKNTISKYENGEEKPNYEFLVRVALDHYVSLDWLFGLTDNRYNPNKGK